MSNATNNALSHRPVSTSTAPNVTLAPVKTLKVNNTVVLASQDNVPMGYIVCFGYYYASTNPLMAFNLANKASSPLLASDCAEACFNSYEAAIDWLKTAPKRDLSKTWRDCLNLSRITKR